MTELQQYIGAYFGVEQAHLQSISNLFEETTLAKGEFFCRSGKYCEKLSFVKRGLIRIYAEVDDKEITQWISAPGYFVTDLASLVFKKEARWNIQALTDCELYTISGERYRRIGEVIPNWDRLEKMFLANCFMTLEDRVFKHLSMSAAERYHELFAQNPSLFNEVPLQYLASMLGMTPETLSRIRAKAIS